MERCGWVSQDPLYIDYHDNEWGVPETDSKKLFEMICLEGPAGWIIVDHRPQKTRKLSRMLSPVRSGGRRRNAEEDVERLVQDAGIIRHRGKIQAIIGNAQAYLANGTERRTVCRLCLVVCQHQPQVTQATTLSGNPDIYARPPMRYRRP